ncbi:MAG: hypothetical protein LBC81_00215 [Tannerellaceae bacterium]|jgi:hypothetical protein|nr:hypothetical protein [Tannerellaceae bacterium]
MDHFQVSKKNNKTIGADRLENISHIYPELDPVWLLTGKGEMLNSVKQKSMAEHATSDVSYMLELS